MKTKRINLLLAGAFALTISLNPLRAAEVQTFDAKTPLQTLQAAAKGGNPSAQDELARRLIAGMARSPQFTRLLEDGETELRSDFSRGRDRYLPPFLPRETERSLDISNTQVADSADATSWKEEFMKKRERFIKLKASIEEKEAKEAVELLESAVAKGDVSSMLFLAGLLTAGKSIPMNLERSFELTRKAAELGEVAAVTNLGIKYAKGRGVKEDMMEAVNWFGKGCEKGDFRAYSLLASILTDGGLDGKDQGYPKNPGRAYVLGRALQLASEQGSTTYGWGAESVRKARQHLETDQLVAAETEAEKEAARLKSVSTANVRPLLPPTDLRNAAAITKQEWKKRFGQLHPIFAQAGAIQMRKDDFVKLCGEPQKTQTIGDKVFWYYKCKDGLIQLDLVKGNLLGGIVAGQVNDY